MNQVNEEFQAQFQNDAEFERMNRQFQAEVVPGSEADIKKFGEGFIKMRISRETKVFLVRWLILAIISLTITYLIK